MAKDPAVLFYWNDWHGGTITFSRFLKGCYMDVMHAQFNNGKLSLDEIKTVLGSDFGSAWPTLQKKFAKDDNGLFFNKRLVFESDKRKSFTKSRRNNLNSSPHMDHHMENENENRIEIKNINERKIIFIENVTEKIQTPDIKILNEFIDYWTEHNENGKKMRFEMQKVFDISRRWATWLRNNTKFTTNGKSNRTENTISNANTILTRRGIDPNKFLQNADNS